MGQKELPPRARRIHENRHGTLELGGTTSACAENTPTKGLLIFEMRNYLRVRGEYIGTYFADLSQKELPPRARRILQSERSLSLKPGTTSACAENTFGLNPQINLRRNYLRVRGEYFSEPHPEVFCEELPPRARRIHELGKALYTLERTTSACAENTLNELGLL